MVIAVWIEFIDIIKTLGHLVITGHSFGTQCSCHGTNPVGLKKFEGFFAIILYPNLHLSVKLKGSDVQVFGGPLQAFGSELFS